MSKFDMFLENIGLRNTSTGEKKPLGKIITAVLIVLLAFLAIIFGNKLLTNKKDNTLSDIKFELQGNTTMVLFLNQKYEEPGFVATDEYGNNINDKVTIIGEVDITTPGIYEINYKLNKNGATITKTRTITVVDEQQTVFVLKGESDQIIKQGDPFVDPGYIIILPGETNPEKYVTTEGKVDTNTPGIYRIIYKLEKDTIKQELVRTVTVKADASEAPIITLLGQQSISIRFGEKYTEQGYTAFDSKDGDITSKVTITSNLKTQIPGIYEVIYKVTNSRGATDTKSRIVRVLEKGDNTFNQVGELSDYVEITKATTSVTRGSITLTIKVINDDVNRILLPDNTITTSKNIKYNIRENGTYIFTVETIDGTLISGSIVVDNIDNAGPTGTCQAILKNNKVSYAVNATDDVSGVAGYSYNKLNTFTEYMEENVYEFDLGNIEHDTALTYNVIVKDKAGNTTKLTCTSETLSTITSIKINGETKGKLGDKIGLEAVITPESAVNKNVFWQIIEGTKFGSIDQNGVVTITSDGKELLTTNNYIVVKATTEDGGLTATHKIQIYLTEESLNESSAPSSGTGGNWNGNITAGLVNPNAIKLQVGEELNINLEDVESNNEELPIITTDDETIVSINGNKIRGEKIGNTTIHIKTGETVHKSFTVSVIDPKCGKAAQYMTQTYQIGNKVGNRVIYGKVQDVAYQGQITIGKNQVLKVTVSLTQKCGETTYLTRTTADGEEGWRNYFEGISDPFVNRYDSTTFLKGQKQYDWIITPKRTTNNRYIALSQTSSQSTTVYGGIKSFGYVNVKVVEENVNIGVPGIPGNPGSPGVNA